MRNLSRPNASATLAFDASVRIVRNRNLRSRLALIRDTVISKTAAYSLLASSGDLSSLPTSDSVDGIVSASEMSDLYRFRMAKKGVPARSIYDEIMAIPTAGICPFCDHGVVSTLDHILPKANFPELVVSPENLVASCGDCNKAKLDHIPQSADESPFHPYYDNVQDHQWLGATLVETSVPALLFEARHVPSWPTAVNNKVRKQFERLGLAKLYGAQAAREISEQSSLLASIYAAGGAPAVRNELIMQASHRERISLNGWRPVTYRVLASSDWYCEGGFSFTS